MPQLGPGVIAGINNIISLPAASTPLDTNKYVTIQSANSRRLEKARIADLGGGGVAGTGTTNRVGKFTAASTVGNSNIADDGTTVSITGALSVSTTSHLIGNVTADGNVAVGGFISESVGVGLAAIGTNRGNSLALTKQLNIVATAASTAVGVTLPAASAVGVGGFVDVYNDGPSNSFHVYAAGSDTIDTIAGATGVVLTNGFGCRYFVTASGTYASFRSAITRSA
jgi:hypothetical protein